MDDRPHRMPQTAQVVRSPPRRQAKPADPCAMVIFGATGDLTKRLVIPALYNLSRTKVLPEHFALIGVARAQGTTESWRDQLYDTLKSFVGNATTEFDVEQIDEAAWKRLAEKMVYVRGDLNKPELYDKLRIALVQFVPAFCLRHRRQSMRTEQRRQPIGGTLAIASNRDASTGRLLLGGISLNGRVKVFFFLLRAGIGKIAPPTTTGIDRCTCRRLVPCSFDCTKRGKDRYGSCR